MRSTIAQFSLDIRVPNHLNTRYTKAKSNVLANTAWFKTRIFAHPWKVTLLLFQTLQSDVLWELHLRELLQGNSTEHEQGGGRYKEMSAGCNAEVLFERRGAKEYYTIAEQVHIQRKVWMSRSASTFVLSYTNPGGCHITSSQKHTPKNWFQSEP